MSDVAELEAFRDVHLQLKARREMVSRLYGNPDFKALIVQGFCRDDAARYVQESGDPALTMEQRADAMAIAQASGHLKRFLAVTMQMAANSDQTLEELDAALIEARSEEDAETAGIAG